MSKLQYYRREVGRLKPGQQIDIDYWSLDFPVPHGFTPMDWILEGIVGSAWGWSYERTYQNTVRFMRANAEETDHPTYISPDKKDLYEFLRNRAEDAKTKKHR